MSIITSLLDQDFYKLTQGQMVFNQFPEARVVYAFKNRGTHRFTVAFLEDLRREINEMSLLSMSNEEYAYLKVIRFLKPTYLEWFRNYRYDPTDVTVSLTSDGDLNLEVAGPWYRTIYWEVPLMALISELYFRGQTKAADWKDRISFKAYQLGLHNVNWLDFGTRRRADFETQNEVVARMKYYCLNGFYGTSNVLLAMNHGVKCQGTIAHETYQAMQAKYGIAMSNQMATEHWIREYGGDLGIMLPDTLTTDVFMRTLSRRDAKLFDGARQDSGDLIVAAKKYIDRLIALDIDPASKVLVPSDSLNVEKAIEFANHFRGQVKGVTAGIGTFLSNDCGFKPLNMVIKMVGADFGMGMIPVVKLSDVPGKYTGDANRIALAKQELGIA